MLTRLIGAPLAALGLLVGSASAQTSLKLTLDFIMFGPNSPFVFADEGGYFKDAGLSVRVDPFVRLGRRGQPPGQRGLRYRLCRRRDGDRVRREEPRHRAEGRAVHSGPHAGDDPGAQEGRRRQAGRPRGAYAWPDRLDPDAGARLSPTFARIDGIDVSKINRQIVDFRLRDSMFAQGKFDAIIAFANSLLNVRTLGLDPAEVVRLDYADHGLNFYGNAMIASRQLLASNPQAVRGAVEAVAKAWRDAEFATRSRSSTHWRSATT